MKSLAAACVIRIALGRICAAKRAGGGALRPYGKSSRMASGAMASSEALSEKCAAAAAIIISLA